MIVDVNAFLGPWPFRRLTYSGVEGIERLMERSGVSHALVSPLESLFFGDNLAANAAILKLAGTRSLIPIVAINPLLPDATELLGEVADHRAIRGLKLHPGYHGYELGDGSAALAFDFAEERDLPVMIPVRVQDERLHPRSAMVSPTSPKVLAEVARLYRRVKILVCNARSDELTEVLDSGGSWGNLYAVVSWAQMEGFVASAVGKYGPGRLMWGSNMPLQYPEPTLEQIRKADIEAGEKRRILAENAEGIFNIR